MSETPLEVVETKLNRLRVGDRVERQVDGIGYVPGTVQAITNEERTYVLVAFDALEEGGEPGPELELTEEEVRRIP